MQSHSSKKSKKKFLITTQLIYRQIISVTTNLTYRTYGLLTTNQSSYLKQEIKSKKNLTGTDSLIHFFIHSFIHFLIHAFIHSFLPWLPSITPSLIHFFLLYMQTCFHVSSQIVMTCLTKEFQTYFLPNIN